MAALTPPIAGKLGRFIRLLGSDRDGEVIAAARALIRVLNTAGTDLHALADHVEQTNGAKLSEQEMKKLYDAGYEAGVRAGEGLRHGNDDFHNADGSPAWNEIAQFCQQEQDRLSTREQEFINSVAAHTVYREPTEKQAKWLKAIFLRLGGKLA